jgi:hypothetical protein
MREKDQLNPKFRKRKRQEELTSAEVWESEAEERKI